MSSSIFARQHRKGPTALSDLGLIVAAILLVFVCAVLFDVFGALTRLFIDSHTRIDAILAMLPLLSIAFVVFSVRRWAELKAEIAERRQTERELRHSEEQLRSLVQAALNVILVLDTDFRIVEFNPEAERLYGHAREDVIGKDYLELFVPEAIRAELAADAQKVLAGEPTKGFEHGIRLPDGTERVLVWNINRLLDAQGHPYRIVSVGQDITERKRYEERLAYLATHDPLTGLPNRRTLEDALGRAGSRARRGVSSSLLFLDLDDFKRINDTLGHNAGDRALVALTRRIQSQLRAEDLLVRLGGDEFAALLAGTEVERARIVAERMRDTLRETPFTLDGQDFRLSLSVGLVSVDGDLPPETLLSHADVAMYRAKGQGGNRVVLA